MNKQQPTSTIANLMSQSLLLQDWCDHMPWGPETSIALQDANMFLDEDEARRVAEQWHPGMWSSMYSFASTGVISDLGSLCKELAECLIEAGQNPRYATSLNNLVAYIAINTHPSLMANAAY